MKKYGMIGLICLVAGCVGCDERDAQNAVSGITIMCRKKGDTAEVKKRDDSLDILIFSMSGIGEAAIDFPKDIKSDEIRFLFQYSDGEPFHRLESFRVISAPIRFQTFLGHQDSIQIEISGENPRAYAANVPVRKTEKGVEVLVPETLMEDLSDSISVFWVDMYRR